MDTDSAQFPTQPRVVRAHSAYGIRPHLRLSDEDETVLRQGNWSVTAEFPITALNRPAVELMFDRCLKCWMPVRVCECHERGYN